MSMIKHDSEDHVDDMTFHCFTIRKIMETILNMTKVMMMPALSDEVGRRSSTIIVPSRWHLPPCEVKKMRETILNITQVMIWCALSAEVGLCSCEIPVLSRWRIAAIFEFDSIPVLASYCSLLLVSALMASLLFNFMFGCLAVCGIC